MGKKSGSGSGMNNLDHISESLKNSLLGLNTKFFDVNSGSEKEKSDPGSGIKKVGSGITIPDPEHWFKDRR